MQINNSPLMTCQNYRINSFEIKTADIKKKDKHFANIHFSGLRRNSSLCQCQKLIEQENNFVQSFTLKEEVSSLTFDFDNKNNYLVDSLVFSLPEGKESTLILDYNNLQNAYHNGAVKFVCKQGSNLNVALVVTSSFSTNLLDISCVLQKNAKADFTIIDFSSQTSVYKFDSVLKGENSEFILNTIYFGEQKAKLDFNYISTIFAPNCKANINIVGALTGESQKSFKGDIDFRRGAKKSKGIEKDFCLLLSKEASSKSMPMLLCTEEDVDGSHSSSTGQIDKNVMFYLMSRGLDRAEALKLYVKSSFASLLKNVPQSIQTKVEEMIDRKIENEEL